MTQLNPDRHRMRGRTFPVVARPDATPTPASTTRWFVTAHSTRPQTVKGRMEEWPVSLVHAKRMGSAATACGAPASSWPKLFHLPFPPPRTETCPDCLAMVRTSRA